MQELLSLRILVLIFAIVGNLLLASLVYASDRKSATNKTFGFLSILISVWLVVLYIAQAPSFTSSALFWTRLSIFLATPMSAVFFLLAITLPLSKTPLNKIWWAVVLLLILVGMGISISPYAFTGLNTAVTPPQPLTGWGISVFGMISTLFSVAAVVTLFVRRRRATGTEREELGLMMNGILLMLGLIILTIFIPVAIFHNAAPVALAPIYTLIFLGMTAYAIVHDQLFNLKMIATEALTVILWLALFAKIFVSNSSSERIADIFIFLVSLVFGVLLIRSVRKEVRQREELQALNGKLDAANKQLEELSRFKSQLLSLASHQIRSPLAAIKGFGSLITEGLYGPVPDKVKETVEKMKASAEDLIGLINTLLDLRKVDEGKMDYRMARTDLRQLVSQVFELMKPLAEAKKLEFTFVPPAKEVAVNADAEKLKQVIQNLTDNAIKYTPNGFVHLELAAEGRFAVVTVSDSGLGIPATLIPYLFEEFIRDERVKQQIRGTGLGLYIARKIAEAHGGTLSASSEGEGKGSVFRLKLPLVV